MLHLYISYAPDDAKQLIKLLRWLKPLEEKYFVRVWYNRPPPPPPALPLPWNILLFWYSPPRHKAPYHPDMPEQLEKAHIYLFLTSHKSITVPWITQIEIPQAVDRYTRLGASFIRIFPVVLTPSHWKRHSRLAGFKPIGPSKSLAEIKPEEEGYLQVVDQLRPIVEELRQNWIEETHRLGLPTDDFFRPPQAALPGPEPASLPGWAGWVLLALLLYSVTNWYTTSCAPRMYHKYKPSILPAQKRTDEYWRLNPVLPPQEVPHVPDKDSIKLSR